MAAQNPIPRRISLMMNSAYFQAAGFGGIAGFLPSPTRASWSSSEGDTGGKREKQHALFFLMRLRIVFQEKVSGRPREIRQNNECRKHHEHVQPWTARCQTGFTASSQIDRHDWKQRSFIYPLDESWLAVLGPKLRIEPNLPLFRQLDR